MRLIEYINPLPKKAAIAVSGGCDSMAILDFMTRDNKRDVTALFFDHGTECSKQSRVLVSSFCASRNIPLHLGEIRRDRKYSESQEEYWRNVRYKFFSQFVEFRPVVTCHHLDDVIETWVFSGINGEPKLIQYKRDDGILRPFLLSKKENLREWCVKHSVPYIEDASNADVSFPRNRIRHNVIPELKQINPGIYKVFQKKIRKILEQS